MPSGSPERSDAPGQAGWPSLADIEAARRRIAGNAIETPLIPSELSTDAGGEVLLKLECLQPTGSFKLRGATNRLKRLSPDAARRGVVTFSTGNHGRAVAHAAARLGIKATVCLSSLVPADKVAAVARSGAVLRRAGASQDEAEQEASRLAREGGLTLIHPIDDFDVIAGQGTIGLELLAQRPDLEAIVTPLSGGGLASGVAVAAKALKPGIRVIGVSMDRGAAMAESLRAGRPVLVEEVPSLADSLGGGIGLANRFTFEICRALLDEVVLVTEVEIYRGMRALFEQDALVAEGACAVGHAAILAGKVAVRGPTALVITGRNVDRRQFAAVAAGRPVTLGALTIGSDGERHA